MMKLGQVVLKEVNLVHNTKIRSSGLERSQIGYTMLKSLHLVLKVVNWVHNAKIRSYGLGRSRLDIQG